MVSLCALAGCRSGDFTVASAAPATPAPVPSPSPAPAGTPATPGTLSAPDASNRQAKRPAFDAKAAFALLEKQCAFGPRPLGTPAHEKTKEFLLAEMKKVADDTVAQTFMYRGMPVTNVIGVIYPAGQNTPAKNPVLLITHWDSRPIADGPGSSLARQSPPYRYGAKGWNRTDPIPAANDGASGTAVLLQLARMFKAQPPPVGVLLILDDGEDYGDFQANGGAGEGVELGSRYFAKHFQADSRFGFPDYGILLDMVGGKDLMFPVESNSAKYAPGTLTKVYQAGLQLGYGSVFRTDCEHSVGDDHLALNQARIRTIDLIPYFGDIPAGMQGYPYWHTLQDTPDKCSPASLKIVGETVAEVIYNETAPP